MSIDWTLRETVQAKLRIHRINTRENYNGKLCSKNFDTVMLDNAARNIDLIGHKNIDLKLKDSSFYQCEGWDSNPRRPSPEDLKSSPLS